MSNEAYFCTSKQRDDGSNAAVDEFLRRHLFSFHNASILIRNDDLDPPVTLPAFGRFVAGNGVLDAITADHEPAGIDPLARENIPYRFGAAFGETLVVFHGPGTVGC